MNLRLHLRMPIAWAANFSRFEPQQQKQTLEGKNKNHVQRLRGHAIFMVYI